MKCGSVHLRSMISAIYCHRFSNNEQFNDDDENDDDEKGDDHLDWN